MRYLDILTLAFESLRAHPLRTALTTLGMMFGVGAVIATLSIGAGAEQEALRLISQLGKNNVVVRAKRFNPDELKKIRKESLGLSPRDITALQESIDHIGDVLPSIDVEAFQVLSETQKIKVPAIGVSHRQGQSLQLTEGRFLDAYDEHHHAQVAVIGSGLRRRLFGGEQAIGRRIKVDDVWLEVVGALAADGLGGATVGGVTLTSSDNAVYLPYTTALRKFRRDPLRAPLSALTIRIVDGASPAAVGEIVRAVLTRLHAGVDDFEVIVPEALMRQSQQTQRLFSLVMGLIAGISLLVGGIGIMNVMLASVLEQTREIGVRRAVGATQAAILQEFLATSFLLSLAGGIVGVAAGIAIARGVAAYADWPTVVTAGSVVISLGVCVVVGIVSGLYPALRAARLDPVVALSSD